ncbi:hypothetical protein D7Z26_22220 [Cohnella endophytica]|uniref:Uncharacterized protein n=1 Tax=Cohnella endophytica TaxID=2419778 RepID=A0A494XBM9_9BACL|nr:hypothetical protein [Cohnella endophytica]RKP47928.1 hypothetical protein D7Z26_22220 [Cohnella endophytica]
MSSQYDVRNELTPIFQCDSKLHQTLKSHRDQLHQLCASHAHRLVKVETMDGDVFEGHIHYCDRGILYLRLSNEGLNRGFFPGPPDPYNNFVLPLVLFNLLAISLI